MTLKSVLKIIIIKLKEKKKTQCKVIKKKPGGISDVCGTPPRNLLPLLFVVRHHRAWEQGSMSFFFLVRMISTGFPLGSLATDLQVHKLSIQLTLVRICWSWSVVRAQWRNKVWTWFAQEHATHILYRGPGLAANELLPSLVLHKRFKRTLFIRSKHNMQIFRVISFIKLQKDTEQLNSEKWWKMRWKAKTLICFGLSYVQCLKEWVFMSFCVQSFNVLPSTGLENNMAHPKTDKVLALHLIFHCISPFNC